MCYLRLFASAGPFVRLDLRLRCKNWLEHSVRLYIATAAAGTKVQSTLVITMWRFKDFFIVITDYRYNERYFGKRTGIGAQETLSHRPLCGVLGIVITRVDCRCCE